MSLLKLLREFSNNSFIDKIKSNPNFKSWFKNSKVVDSKNNPEVVFHGTYNDFTEFEKGDLGFHFGTQKSVEDRLKDKRGFDKGRTGIFFLSIQNPLETRDARFWDFPPNVIDVVEEALDIKHEVRNYIYENDKYKGQLYRGLSNQKKLKMIKEYLRDNYNIDGIKYKNEYEDKGSYSWIAFYPEQIKSIFNRGEFNKKSENILE